MCRFDTTRASCFRWEHTNIQTARVRNACVNRTSVIYTNCWGGKPEQRNRIKNEILQIIWRFLPVCVIRIVDTYLFTARNGKHFFPALEKKGLMSFEHLFVIGTLFSNLIPLTLIYWNRTLFFPFHCKGKLQWHRVIYGVNWNKVFRTFYFWIEIGRRFNRSKQTYLKCLRFKCPNNASHPHLLELKHGKIPITTHFNKSINLYLSLI